MINVSCLNINIISKKISATLFIVPSLIKSHCLDLHVCLIERMSTLIRCDLHQNSLLSKLWKLFWVYPVKPVWIMLWFIMQNKRSRNKTLLSRQKLLHKRWQMNGVGDTYVYWDVKAPLILLFLLFNFLTNLCLWLFFKSLCLFTCSI